MGNCVIHLFGSNSAMAEMVTEERLGNTLAARTSAISTTYSSFHQWEQAYVEDIRGNTNEAVDHYEDAISQAGTARAEWKKAEFRQTELMSHLAAQPRNSGVRAPVREQITELDEQDHLTDLQSRVRFPRFVNVDQVDDMIQFGTEMLDISIDEISIDEVFNEEEDPVMTEIMELFALDLYQIRRMKIAMDKVKQTFEEHKSDVEEAKLLESLQAAHHLDQEPHPVTEVTSEARNILISYVAFVESYGPYITNAVIRADDDMPKQHLDAYVRGNDSQPISKRLDY